MARVPRDGNSSTRLTLPLIRLLLLRLRSIYQAAVVEFTSRIITRRYANRATVLLPPFRSNKFKARTSRFVREEKRLNEITIEKI